MCTPEEVKRIQSRLLEMAVSVRDILEKQNIPYFLAYGSLLGAVRHQGFIPWDDDFDLYLFDDSYEEAMTVLKKELPEDMFLEYWDSEPKYFHAWAHVKDVHSRTECESYPQDGHYEHQGISLDLYRIKEMPFSSVEEYRLTESIAYLDRRKDKGLIDLEDYEHKMKPLLEKKQHIHHSNDLHQVFATILPALETIEVFDLLPLKKYLFEDYEFYGPANADSFLTQRYGDYMKLPPVELQRPHYSSVLFF